MYIGEIMKYKNRDVSKNIEDRRSKHKTPWIDNVKLEYINPKTGKTTKHKYHRSSK